MPKKRQTLAESGLSARQERVLLALLSSPTHEAAAKQAGVAGRTLRSYLQLPEFRAEYLQRRRELMSAAIALAQQNAVAMVAVQITIARDATMPASIRVSAANNVFGIADAGLKTETIEERIQALEEQLEELGIKAGTNGKISKYPIRG
jgi:hypothetical protein